MPAFNFQARFAPKVAEGIKRQTMRRWRKDGRDPQVGARLTLYTGMRTKRCRKLGAARCRQVDVVRVDATSIELDGRLLSRAERDQFARRDGFADFADLLDWLGPKGLPFFGLVYYW